MQSWTVVQIEIKIIYSEIATRIKMKVSKYLPILKIGAEGKGNKILKKLQNDG